MGLEVIGDITGMWQEGTASIAGGVAGLGATGMGDTIMVLADALDVLSGSMAIVSGISTVMQNINAVKAGQATAETAASMAMGPIGWGKIALALGAMTASAAVVGGFMHYTLKGNLSNPAELQGITQTIGAIA